MAKTWREVLEAQDGVLGRAQAVAGGMSLHAWAWKQQRGLWQTPLPGVAVAHSGPLDDRQRAWAAMLYGGSGALVSGDASLVLRGLNVATKVVDLVIPVRRRVVSQAREGGLRVEVHRVAGLERWVSDVRGLRMTTAHAAVLHAAAWAGSDRAAEWRIAASVQRRVTAVPLLRTTLEQMRGLARGALLRAVLDDVELGAHAGSELQFLRFCRAYGLPLPDEMQLRVRRGSTHYLDARYVRQRVSVELDGAHHRDAGQWEADALRTLRVTAALPGERVLRLTPGMLRHDGEEVAALLRVILA